MKKIISYVVIALAAVGLAWAVITRINAPAAGTESKKTNRPPVRIAVAEHEDLTYRLDFSGDVNPARQANVFSKVTGNIERLYADMGQTVHEGAMLALIDTAALGATLQQTRTSYVNARVQYNRTKDLAAKGLAAQQDLDNAETAMNVAKANYELAQTQLDYAKVRAPFSGVITKRYLDQGAVVSTSTVQASAGSQSNSTLFTIMDLSSVKVLINVLDKDIAALSGVHKAIVTIDGIPGRTFDGYVTRTSDAVSTTTRTMTAEVTIQNRDGAIKPGMFARVSLVLGEHPNALTVPSEAVMSDTTGHFVYVVSADSVAHRTGVQTGIEEKARTEILSGLDQNEWVIVSGQNFVKDKNRVLIEH